MDDRGQTALETALLVGATVVALTTMAAYLHRGYAGYLYGNSSAQGTQFDPRRSYEQHDTLEAWSQVQDVEMLSGAAAAELFTADGSGGRGPGRPVATRQRAETTWEFSRDARYEAQ